MTSSTDKLRKAAAQRVRGRSGDDNNDPRDGRQGRQYKTKGYTLREYDPDNYRGMKHNVPAVGHFSNRNAEDHSDRQIRSAPSVARYNPGRTVKSGPATGRGGYNTPTGTRSTGGYVTPRTTQTTHSPNLSTGRSYYSGKSPASKSVYTSRGSSTPASRTTYKTAYNQALKRKLKGG